MILSTKEAAARTGLKRSMIMQLVHMPESPWFQIGERAWVVYEDDLHQQIQKIKERKVAR